MNKNHSYTLRVRCGKAGGGKGPLIQEDKSGSLTTSNDQSLFVPEAKIYGISAYESNSMRSPNPHSGVYEAETARTLDLNGGSPACNQGGIAIVEKTNEEVFPIEGNGARPSHKGPGFSDESVSYTLNSTEVHAIGSRYAVRRFTPKECGRLQGFPDDWCEGIPHTDSAEYKMWGNGMALPCALYVMEGAEAYFRELYGDDEE